MVCLVGERDLGQRRPSQHGTPAFRYRSTNENITRAIAGPPRPRAHEHHPRHRPITEVKHQLSASTPASRIQSSGCSGIKLREMDGMPALAGSGIWRRDGRRIGGPTEGAHGRGKCVKDLQAGNADAPG